MKLFLNIISCTSCTTAFPLAIILFLALASAVALGIVEIINSKRFNPNHYVETTARVIDYNIMLTRYRTEKTYYITINLEYSINNKTVNSWTDDKVIESRSKGEKYFADLDKNETAVIYKKDNIHEAIILPVKWKFKNLWKGWIVIGTTLVGSTICVLLCYCISFSSFILSKELDPYA